MAVLVHIFAALKLLFTEILFSGGKFFFFFFFSSSLFDERKMLNDVQMPIATHTTTFR